VTYTVAWATVATNAFKGILILESVLNHNNLIVSSFWLRAVAQSIHLQLTKKCTLPDRQADARYRMAHQSPDYARISDMGNVSTHAACAWG
jgi:hypothetical protein